jgi:hypothetical protein
MKKLVPFVFPLIAILIVIVAAVRWYSDHSAQSGKISDTAATTQVEPNGATGSGNLSHATSAKDAHTVFLSGQAPAQGEVRSEIKNGTVWYTITADLPKQKTEKYLVWMVTSTSAVPKKVFLLEQNKGGFIGSGSVSTSLLPITFEITLEKNQPNISSNIILSGILSNN